MPPSELGAAFLWVQALHTKSHPVLHFYMVRISVLVLHFQ